MPTAVQGLKAYRAGAICRFRPSYLGNGARAMASKDLQVPVINRQRRRVNRKSHKCRPNKLRGIRRHTKEPTKKLAC